MNKIICYVLVFCLFSYNVINAIENNANNKEIDNILNKVDSTKTKLNTNSVKKNDNKFTIQEKFALDPEPNKHIGINLIYAGFPSSSIEIVSGKKSSLASNVGAGVNFSVNLYPRLRLGVEVSGFGSLSSFSYQKSVDYGFTKVKVDNLGTINSYFYGEFDVYKNNNLNIYALAGVGYSGSFFKINKAVYKKTNTILAKDRVMAYLSTKEMADLLQKAKSNEDTIIVNSFNLSQEDYDEIQKNNHTNYCTAEGFKTDCLGSNASVNVVANCDYKNSNWEIAKACYDEIDKLTKAEEKKAQEEFLANNPNFDPNKPINYNRSLSEQDSNYLSNSSFASGIVGNNFICSSALTPTYLNTFDLVKDNFGIVLGHSRYNVIKEVWVDEYGEDVPAPNIWKDKDGKEVWLNKEGKEVPTNIYEFPKKINKIDRNEAYDKNIGYFIAKNGVYEEGEADKTKLKFSVALIDYNKGVKQKYENGVLNCAYSFKTVYLDTSIDIKNDVKNFRTCSGDKENACDKSPTRVVKKEVQKLLGDDISVALDNINFNDNIFNNALKNIEQYTIEESSQNVYYSSVSYKIGFGINVFASKNISYYLNTTYNYNQPINSKHFIELPSDEIFYIKEQLKIKTSFFSINLGISYNWY